MTNEILEKAKECKSAEELLALAKENGYEMTAEEAAESFAQLHREGELSDDELDSAAGGSCHKKDGRMVVSLFYRCDHFRCKRCGEKAFESHDTPQGIVYEGCKCNVKGKGSASSDGCGSCKFMSYEKGLWLCNNEANMQ